MTGTSSSQHDDFVTHQSDVEDENTSKQETTLITTFDSTMMTGQYNDSEEDNNSIERVVEEQEDAMADVLAQRFVGPQHLDRFDLISNALNKAGAAYVEESESKYHDPAFFYNRTIDRVLMTVLDPTAATRSIGRSFSYEDMEESTLTDLVDNMKTVIASQREEIDCLRKTVKELILEIADGENFGGSREVPKLIKIQESSSERSTTNKDIFRRKRVGIPPNKDSESSYSYLLSSIAHSRSSVSSGYHIEPEGDYLPERTLSKQKRVKKKEDPPSDDNDKSNYGGPAEDLNFLERERELPPIKPTAQHSTSLRSSPTKERAISILEERRIRFRNFRQMHDQKEYVSDRNRTHPSHGKISPRTLTPTRQTRQNHGVSPIVHFREDELTLLETTSKKSNGA
jgi:hypothetical protein